MPNFSLRHKGANSTLSYAVSGSTYTAGLRVTEANYAYGVQSSESHARLDRAFYPHRRALGSFVLHVQCKGYAEYKSLQTWITNYTNTLFTGAMSNQGNTTLMHVQVPNRDFDKYGILISGMGDQDHVGSMVFEVELTFMTLKDANDPSISILKLDQVSTFNAPAVDANITLAFYPVTSAKYKDSELYDDLSQTSVNPSGSMPDPNDDPPSYITTPGGGRKPI